MLNTGHFFSVGVGGVIYSSGWNAHKVENNTLTLLALFGRISRCTESIHLSHKRTPKAEKAPLGKYFKVEVPSLSVPWTTRSLKSCTDDKSCIELH